jgi:hypothetical protein
MRLNAPIQQTKPLLANYRYPSTLRTIVAAGPDKPGKAFIRKPSGGDPDRSRVSLADCWRLIGRNYGD